LAKFLLEGVEVGTDGGDPVGVEGFFDLGEFFFAHVGGGEEDLGWVHGF
jgi:hypothetical protein